MCHARDYISELVDVGCSVVKSGLAVASGGNLSARIPGTETFVVTGAGAWLDKLSDETFTIMSLAGEVLEGNPKPSSEWKLHQKTFMARPDVNSIVHVHPQHAVLLDALGHDIRMITLDHASYIRSIGISAFHPNGSDKLADAAAAQAQTHNCVIMRHHGCSTMGESIEMAYRRALNLEEAAIATFRALALGDTTTMFPENEFHHLHHS
nr:class II aldolase/adducin family protein [Arthrobacter castelli]